MNKRNFDAAVKAAKEFSEQAKRIEWREFGVLILAETGRETGTLRRKSMDLTRALADLRKPN